MLPFLENLIEDGFIPDKKLWSKITIQSIEIVEENKLKSTVQRRPELRRYFKIHNRLSEHRLYLKLAACYPQLNKKFLTLVKLGSIAIKAGQCSYCLKFESDILKHLILGCEELWTNVTVCFIQLLIFYTCKSRLNFSYKMTSL